MPLEIPSGSITVMRNNTPPTGWTKTNTFNANCLRVVNSTASSGGSIDTTTVFATQFSASVTSTTESIGSTSLNASMMPLHSHNYANAGSTRTAPSTSPAPVSVLAGAVGTVPANRSGPAILGNAHSHPISGITVSGITGTLDMRIKYVDNILVQRA